MARRNKLIKHIFGWMRMARNWMFVWMGQCARHVQWAIRRDIATGIGTTAGKPWWDSCGFINAKDILFCMPFYYALATSKLTEYCRNIWWPVSLLQSGYTSVKMKYRALSPQRQESSGTSVSCCVTFYCCVRNTIIIIFWCIASTRILT